MGIAVTLFGLVKIASLKYHPKNNPSPPQESEKLVSTLSTSRSKNLSVEWQAPLRNYPNPDTFSFKGNAIVATYSPDSLLNARIKVYLERYRPETGVILISDLKSGHILGLGEREDSTISNKPKIAFGSGFPAASLIKILTAISALECNHKFVTDSIPQWGSYHTLYRSQLHLDRPGRQVKITLEEAFSKSVNPAFALLGLSMGPAALRSQAQKLGFNRPLLPEGVAQSRIDFPDTGYSLAEASCGFTTKTTISPWHALEIARGAGDDGKLRDCKFIHSITDLTSGKELEVNQDNGSTFLSAQNLPRLQSLMEATVRVGTARKGFHSTLKANQMERIEVGGKTGSLDGQETPGRFDWFIGYVKLKDNPSHGLAFSIMLVHREYSTIHASQLAALIIRDWLIALEKAKKLEMSYRAV